MNLIRNSLDFASWKNRKLLAAALKPLYCAPSAEAAEQSLSEFEVGHRVDLPPFTVTCPPPTVPG